MLIQTLSVANLLLHVNIWREVQRDMAMLMSEMQTVMCVRERHLLVKRVKTLLHV